MLGSLDEHIISSTWIIRWLQSCRDCLRSEHSSRRCPQSPLARTRSWALAPERSSAVEGPQGRCLKINLGKVKEKQLEKLEGIEIQNGWHLWALTSWTPFLLWKINVFGQRAWSRRPHFGWAPGSENDCHGTTDNRHPQLHLLHKRRILCGVNHDCLTLAH